MMNSGFDFMFNLFPIFFFIIFAMVIGTFAAAAVRGVTRWNRNNHSPRLTVPARVIGKREEVHSHHHHQDAHVHTHYSTT